MSHSREKSKTKHLFDLLLNYLHCKNVLVYFNIFLIISIGCEIGNKKKKISHDKYIFHDLKSSCEQILMKIPNIVTIETSHLRN